MSYWIVWPVGIALWLGLGWIEFGVVERKAINSTDPNKPTLSRFVYTIATKFPFAMATACIALGYFWGDLLTHFLWHWCPPGSISAG